MRAQFYSILTLLLTLPIFIFTVNYLTYSQKISYDLSDRIISDQLHQLVRSIELDTEKAMEICGRRAMIAASNFVIDSGIPLENAAKNISRLMVYGDINGTSNFFMINNTMPNWSNRISSKPVNFDLLLEYNNITVKNYDGFSISVSLDINITASDKLKISKIEKPEVHKIVIISVLGMEDPLFPMNTQGFMRRTIQRASPSYFSRKVVSTTGNASGSCNGKVTFNKAENNNEKILVAHDSSSVDFSYHRGVILEVSENLTGDTDCYLTGNDSSVSLINATITSTGYEYIYIDDDSNSAWSMPGAENLQNGYYYAGNGPDFLQRLGGNSTPSANGIVTFIYVPELEEEALEIEDYPRTAYMYFSEQGDCQKVRNTPEWFGIDNAHAAEFNVSELLTGESCYTWAPG